MRVVIYDIFSDLPQHESRLELLEKHGFSPEE
jgi:hypothetical protein